MHLNGQFTMLMACRFTLANIQSCFPHELRVTANIQSCFPHELRVTAVQRRVYLKKSVSGQSCI